MDMPLALAVPNGRKLFNVIRAHYVGVIGDRPSVVTRGLGNILAASNAVDP